MSGNEDDLPWVGEVLDCLTQELAEPNQDKQMNQTDGTPWVDEALDCLTQELAEPNQDKQINQTDGTDCFKDIPTDESKQENIFCKMAKNKLQPIAKRFKRIPINFENQDETPADPRTENPGISDSILNTENITNFYNLITEERELIETFFQDVKQIHEIYNTYLIQKDDAKKKYQQLLNVTKRRTALMIKTLK